MATTERGIYYTAAVDDSSVADFNVITKRIADSVEAGLDTLDAANISAGLVIGGTWAGTTSGTGHASIPLPTSPLGGWAMVASSATGGVSLTVPMFLNGPTPTASVWCHVPLGSGVAPAVTAWNSKAVTIQWMAFAVVA